MPEDPTIPRALRGRLRDTPWSRAAREPAAANSQPPRESPPPEEPRRSIYQERRHRILAEPPRFQPLPHTQSSWVYMPNPSEHIVGRVERADPTETPDPPDNPFTPDGAESISITQLDQLSGPETVNQSVNIPTYTYSYQDMIDSRSLSLEERAARLDLHAEFQVDSSPIDRQRPPGFNLRADEYAENDYRILIQFVKAKYQQLMLMPNVEAEWSVPNHRGHWLPLVPGLSISNTEKSLREDKLPRFHESEELADFLIEKLCRNNRDVQITYGGAAREHRDVTVEIYYSRGHSWAVGGSAIARRRPEAVARAIINQIMSRGGY